MFHAADGWFFERLADGAVKIVKVAGIGETQATTIIPDATWASIVAAVSYRGTNVMTWQEALLFHNGPEDEQPKTED